MNQLARVAIDAAIKLNNAALNASEETWREAQAICADLEALAAEQSETRRSLRRFHLAVRG